MTGSREHSRDFYFKKGFAEMLPKPFSKQELITVLEKIFPERSNLSEEKLLNENVENDVSKNDKFDLSLLKSFLNTDEALEEVLTIFNTQTEQDLQQIKMQLQKKYRKNCRNSTPNANDVPSIKSKCCDFYS